MTCTSRRWRRSSEPSSELAKSLICKAKARYWFALASEHYGNRTPRFAACESASPTKIPTACSWGVPAWRLALGSLVAASLAGCGATPISKAQTGNPEVEAGLIARIEGCNLYRIYDNGSRVYMTVCRGQAERTRWTESCGKGCTRTVETLNGLPEEVAQ